MNLSNLDTNGLIMLFIGLMIRYLIGWRRFRRRHVAGIEVFSGYLASQIILVFERLFYLLGLLLIVSGAITILMRL